MTIQFSLITHTIRLLSAALLIATGLSACGTGEQPAEDGSKEATEMSDSAAAVEQGKRIQKEAFQALSTVLRQKMQEGGVEEALSFCSEKALPITDSVSEAQQAKIRRLAHRYRNPYNKANAEQERQIRSFEKQKSKDKSLVPVVHQEDDRWIYRSPIVIDNQLCLQCHGSPGEDLSDEDYITIQLIYPDDQAHGFKMGDIRGMWQIELALPDA